MAKLLIQGASANYPGDAAAARTKKTPPKLQIQTSSANYDGQKLSGKRTPSPDNKPYPPTKRNPSQGKMPPRGRGK